VTVKRPRFTGILVTAALLGAAILFYRGRPSSETMVEAPGLPQRGGQIVGTMRSEPRTFNRYTVQDQTSATVAMLTQAPLVRRNRATFELEPWLAERWESSADGLTHTVYLRQGLTWSDGSPFSSEDILFSLRAALDPGSKSVFAGTLVAGGQPITAEARDANTVVFKYAAPAGPGIGLLEGLPILPKHKLEAAFASGTFAQAWGTATPPAEIVGMGPFVMREFTPGQRLVLDRNPRYWRKAPDGAPLPYLDRIVLEVVPSQDAELLRLTSGAADFTHSELRAEDYVPARRAEEEGRLRLVELGVGMDADVLWFCMDPRKMSKDPRFAFLQRREFRQAISHAVDREEFAHAVFLGEAVPIWGPITPGNAVWFSPNLPRYPHDLAKARELLKSIGLEDRNGNGVVEDAAGTEARFTVLTQRGITYYERGTTVLRDYAAMVGVALEPVQLEPGALFERLGTCNYDAAYVRPLWSDPDPAGNLDFWLSSGANHLWNMGQETPATDWEKQLDGLMLEQSRTPDLERRRELFNQAQRLFAENVPALYFAAPRLYAGHSTRLQGVVPSPMRPQILWNADMLSVAGGAAPATDSAP
jgi:peptide/nickel transport system substrate-binding protein